MLSLSSRINRRIDGVKTVSMPFITDQSVPLNIEVNLRCPSDERSSSAENWLDIFAKVLPVFDLGW